MRYSKSPNDDYERITGAAFTRPRSPQSSLAGTVGAKHGLFPRGDSETVIFGKAPEAARQIV